MAAALYRLLLLLYPASFRAEYCREMASVFLRSYQRRRTGPARAAFWLETIRDVATNAGAAHLDIFRQDVAAAVRALSRTPAFSLTIIFVAALGIGATTAAFSLADHVLIRPLPFPEPDRLVKLWQNHAARGYARMELSPPNLRDWRAQNTSFDGMAGFLAAVLYFRDVAGALTPIDGATANADLFEVLRVPAALGRTITEDDERPGAPPVIVLSDGLWRSWFNADRGVIGQSISQSDGPRTVIGVMPPGFEFPNRNARFWVPLTFGAADNENRSNYILNVIARLKPGVSIDQAQAELSVIADRLARQYPKTNTETGAVVMNLRDELNPQARLLLWGLVAASLTLLLIACTNLANLLLSRALARQRELAVRAALGAGRQRLVRQLLTETLILAGIGGAIGMVLAVAAVPSVARLVPTSLPIAETPSLDIRMIGAAFFATLMTAASVGIAPALRLGRHADAAALREGPRAGTSRQTERMRSALLVAQIAASIALLVCTGLLVRALIKVQQTDPGFRADGVLTMRTPLPLTDYRDPERRMTFYTRALEEIRALPGVTSASYISYLPMVVRGGIWPVSVDGKAEDEASSDRASFRQVMPGFFFTMDTPVTSGRDFDARDTDGGALVAIVSESFVRRYWPDATPLGRVLSIGGRERTVVGVAGDIRVRGLERESEPQVYIPAAQGAAHLGYIPRELVVRASLAAGAVTPAVRGVIARLDPQMPIGDVRTLREVVDGETAPRRIQVRVIASFAAIACLLSAVGLHGLLSFNVARRARDIGVRMALGARPQSIVHMMVKDAARLAAIGVLAGAGIALAAGRAMQALLAGVSPLDPLTVAGAVAVAAVMTLAGTLLPTLHALRVDPITVIRTE